MRGSLRDGKRCAGRARRDEMRSKNEAHDQRLRVGGSLAVAPVAKVVARSTDARRSVQSSSEMVRARG
jgi:hypothetical protein